MFAKKRAFNCFTKTFKTTCNSDRITAGCSQGNPNTLYGIGPAFPPLAWCLRRCWRQWDLFISEGTWPAQSWWRIPNTFTFQCSLCRLICHCPSLQAIICICTGGNASIWPALLWEDGLARTATGGIWGHRRAVETYSAEEYYCPAKTSHYCWCQDSSVKCCISSDKHLDVANAENQGWIFPFSLGST